MPGAPTLTAVVPAPGSMVTGMAADRPCRLKVSVPLLPLMVRLSAPV